MRVLRAIAFAILAFLSCAIAFTTATILLLLDPRRGRTGHFVARLWGRAMLFASGARLVVRDADRFAPREARVLVANHASFLDIPAVFAAFPGQARFVARTTLIWMPFVGWYIRLGGHFSLDRGDPRQALALMERMADRMRRYGLSPVLFPEGTRSPDGRLAPVKPGSLLLPVSIGVPVQPVAIIGSAAIFPKGAGGPVRSGTIEIRVGEPLSTAGLEGSTGRKALADRVRAALLALGVPDGAPP